MRRHLGKGVEGLEEQRVKFRSIGKNVQIFPMTVFTNPENISIGNYVRIDDFVKIMGGLRTTIGNHVHIASFVNLGGGGELIVEDFAGISSGTQILTGTDDFLGGSLTGPTIPPEFRKPRRSFVRIGKHCVLGIGVMVLPGVTIGEGAVVGAGSVVLKDIEPWTVNVGSPTRTIKKRPGETILRMERELLERGR
jgi:acetyltransferase-like isoleucine patch superfamily enzyme